MEHNVNVRDFIDNRPVSKHQIKILLLALLVVAFDGLDVGIMGFVAPEIIRTWSITKAEMGGVLSSVFFGMAIGAAVAGPIGDRFGRKLVVVFSIFWFGIMTLMSAFAPNTLVLLALRALTGLGLGAAIPATIALLAEYAPQRQRSLFVTICFSGFTAGATMSGLLAAWLIPAFGWQTGLGAAGLLPALSALVLMVWLPESVAFLALKQKTAVIPGILRKIDPRSAFSPDAKFWLPVAAEDRRGSFKTLLSPRYVVTAAMLCLAYFMGVMATYIIVGWLPVISREAGFTLSQGAVITSIFTLAGPIGAITLGAAMDRVSPQKLLVVTFATAGILLACVGFAPLEFTKLCLLMLVLGFFFHGSMAGLQALAPQSFPTSARATGVSSMHAVGRVGAIVSGILGGALIGWGWDFSQIFFALAIPMLICAAAIAVIGLRSSWKVSPTAPPAGGQVHPVNRLAT
jgi:AAHS family 4-hydroxybenzoate transporter-like MFS transporter